MINHKAILTDEQIKQAMQCLFSEYEINGDVLSLKNVNGCIRALEQAVLQTPKVQQAMKEAERYRKARRMDLRQYSDLYVHCLLTGANFDAALDTMEI